jgi:putative membrane protein insertion efficiency factor
MIARCLLLLIRGYQRTLSPLLGPICRFTPSCSNYMMICIQRFGAARGVWLGTRRLLRCHPFHAGGIDLPPESCDHSQRAAALDACRPPLQAQSTGAMPAPRSERIP